MKIAITGGTGFVGSDFAQAAREAGDELIFVTRRAALPPELDGPHATRMSWDDLAFDGVDAVLHLAGENIFAARWSEAQKQRILESRTHSSARVVEAIERASPRPRVLVHASGIGYYGDRGDEVLDESSTKGSGFLADVCEAWEGACAQARELGVRVVPVRTGIVLDADGGAIAKMRRPFSFFVGGPIGSGAQWMSWIHRRDMTGLLRMAIAHERVCDVINAVAPIPVRARTFAKALGRAMRRPSIFPVPGLVLRVVLGEVASTLLESQRVEPRRARELGYDFEFAELSEALEQIVAQF